VTTFTTAADPASLDELEVVDVEDEMALPPELQADAKRATAPMQLRPTARGWRTPRHPPARFLPLRVKLPRIMAIVLPSAQEAHVGRYCHYIQPLWVGSRSGVPAQHFVDVVDTHSPQLRRCAFEPPDRHIGHEAVA
jgi:hypothetical protein